MHTMKRAGLCMLTVLLLANCGRSKQIVQVDGISIYLAEWEKTKSELASRMRFDTNCASPNLRYTLFAKSYRYPTEVGVAGCGKKVVYIREYIGRMNLYLTPWYANTVTQGVSSSPR